MNSCLVCVQEMPRAARLCVVDVTTPTSGRPSVMSQYSCFFDEGKNKTKTPLTLSSVDRMWEEEREAAASTDGKSSHPETIPASCYLRLSPFVVAQHVPRLTFDIDFLDPSLFRPTRPMTSTPMFFSST
jgi:hypothetical protein